MLAVAVGLAAPTRAAVQPVGNATATVETAPVLHTGDAADDPSGTGYLIASSQAASNTANFYAVYQRQGSNAFVRTFRVVNGTAVDGCGRTDGIDAVAADLGPAFPNGMFVCHDYNDSKPGPADNQNFKFVPLERVVGLG